MQYNKNILYGSSVITEPARIFFYVVISISETEGYYLMRILNVAFFPDPSVALAVMVTVPFLPLMVLTLPYLSTIASFVLLEDHADVLTQLANRFIRRRLCEIKMVTGNCQRT